MPSAHARGASGHQTAALPALHDAAWRNDTARLRALLRAGADPDAQESGELNTALHLVAWGTRMTARDPPYWALTQVARLLLEAGANPNLRDFTGITPLHVAATIYQPALMPLLVSHGADVNARIDGDYYRGSIGDGATPLLFAFAQTHKRSPLLRWHSCLRWAQTRRPLALMA
jgi:ankyrin repeat protein